MHWPVGMPVPSAQYMPPVHGSGFAEPAGQYSPCVQEPPVMPSVGVGDVAPRRQ